MRTPSHSLCFDRHSDDSGDLPSSSLPFSALPSPPIAFHRLPAGSDDSGDLQQLLLVVKSVRLLRLLRVARLYRYTSRAPRFLLIPSDSFSPPQRASTTGTYRAGRSTLPSRLALPSHLTYLPTI